MDDSLIFTLVSLCKAVQNLDTKSLLWSEIISLGRPFSQYQLLKNIMARSSTVMLVFVGTIQMSKLRRSVIVRIQSNPSSNSNGPMKSRATPLSCQELAKNVAGP